MEKRLRRGELDTGRDGMRFGWSRRKLVVPVAIRFVAFGIPLSVIQILFNLDVDIIYVWAVAGVAIAALTAMVAWWQTRRPMLEIDAIGISVRSKRLCRWEQIGIAWVSDRLGGGFGPWLLIWTPEAIAFSRTRGFQPTILTTKRLPIRGSAIDVIAAISTYSPDTDIRTGTAKDLTRLTTWMRTAPS